MLHSCAVLEIDIKPVLLKIDLDKKNQKIKQIFSSREACADITRQPDEYRTAFFTNLTCIAVPLLIFYVMCARELLVRLVKLEDRVKEQISNDWLFVVVKMTGRFLWLVLVSPLCCPFFILYIAVRQVTACWKKPKTLK